MIPDQESKSTVPPTCLLLPYYPLPPSLYLCAQFGSLDSPTCSFIRWPCLLNPRSTEQPHCSLHSLSMSTSWDQGLPLPSFWTTRPSCPFCLFISVKPTFILPHFGLYTCLPKPASPSKPPLIFPLHIIPDKPQEPTLQLYHFCTTQDSHPEVDLGI